MGRNTHTVQVAVSYRRMVVVEETCIRKVEVVVICKHKEVAEVTCRHMEAVEVNCRQKLVVVSSNQPLHKKPQGRKALERAIAMLLGQPCLAKMKENSGECF